MLISVEHNNRVRQNECSCFCFNFFVLVYLVNTIEDDLPLLAKKNELANVSMILSICCDSPGRRKLSNKSRSASSILRPGKENCSINAFRMGKLEGLDRNSPNFFLSMPGVTLRNFARTPGSVVDDKKPFSTKYEVY